MRTDPPVVDPRHEADERVAGRFDARVLEPSPPASAEPPFFADDPVQDADGTARPVLAPVSLPGAASTWDELARGDAQLPAWCSDRWLGAWRTLTLPADGDALVMTRGSWHTLAEHVVAAARYHANGKIGLRFTRGGFGTPFFGPGVQVRLTADGVVVVRGGELAVHPVTTAAAAARAIGVEPGAPTEVYAPTTALEPDAPLPTDAASARFLGDWFGFGASVLEQLRAEVGDEDPSRVQLWPEHFDLSFDFGDEAGGTRATYGASPGDAAHPEPYAYVSPWQPQTDGFWNEGSFASLPFAAVAAAADQRGAVLDFFARARAALGPG
jgi:hypothetical protein